MRTERILPLVVGLLACSCGNSSGTAGQGGGSSSASAGTGGAADTWTSFAQGFTATYCVECHNPSDPARDYNKLADVMKDAVEARCGVAPTKLADCTATFPPPKQFPISNGTVTNPKPTDAERDRFVAWIDAGLPQ